VICNHKLVPDPSPNAWSLAGAGGQSRRAAPGPRPPPGAPSAALPAGPV